MKCPFCGYVDTFVIDSREAGEQACIRRRRGCSKCEKRFTTYERVEGIDLKVIKKNGLKEDYDREKLRRGIVKATWKRPVSMAHIEEVIDDVERRLRIKKGQEIKSWEIGNLVVNRLRKLDKLSYLLFASVYRDFASIEDFEQELAELKKSGPSPAEQQEQLENSNDTGEPVSVVTH
ncbi:MAG: transcriptional regulator NrdR [bacterium]|nr:transcriptional regulator NrdR [bacterium]